MYNLSIQQLIAKLKQIHPDMSGFTYDLNDDIVLNFKDLSSMSVREFAYSSPTSQYLYLLMDLIEEGHS